jgi:dTDP-4-dehydrorhamnose 3,5-epimerase
MLIPEGFAHGFQTLTDDVEVLYCVSAPYANAQEGALNALDPRLAIAWPLPVLKRSVRDQSHPLLGPAFEGIVL